MVTILKTKSYTSTKDRSCDCCNYILSYWGLSGLNDLPLTEQELLIIEKAKSNNWMIKKGEKYIYQVMIYDGFQTTSSIPGILAICVKYELFDD